MVKHIVLFKLKEELPATEKQAVMNQFKEAIEALPAKISVIRKIEVGLNVNPAEAMVSMIANARLFDMQMKVIQEAKTNADRANGILSAQ